MVLTGCEAVDGRADDGGLHTRSRVEPHPHRPHVPYGGVSEGPLAARPALVVIAEEKKQVTIPMTPASLPTHLTSLVSTYLAREPPQ